MLRPGALAWAHGMQVRLRLCALVLLLVHTDAESSKLTIGSSPFSNIKCVKPQLGHHCPSEIAQEDSAGKTVRFRIFHDNDGMLCTTTLDPWNFDLVVDCDHSPQAAVTHSESHRWHFSSHEGGSSTHHVEFHSEGSSSSSSFSSSIHLGQLEGASVSKSGAHLGLPEAQDLGGISEVKLVIGSSHDANFKCVKTPIRLDCPRTASQVHSYGKHPDQFHIYTNSHGEVCAERTDHRDPWGSNLVVNCKKMGVEHAKDMAMPEFQASQLFPGLVAIPIGSSLSSSKKCVRDPGHVTCDNQASVKGRHDKYPDKFEISHEKGKICATRVDYDKPWGLDLVLHCLPAKGKIADIVSDHDFVYEVHDLHGGGKSVEEALKALAGGAGSAGGSVGRMQIEIGSSPDSSTKCVPSPGGVTCDDEASQIARDGKWPDTFHVYHHGDQICAHRTDYDKPWGLHLVLHCHHHGHAAHAAAFSESHGFGGDSHEFSGGQAWHSESHSEMSFGGSLGASHGSAYSMIIGSSLQSDLKCVWPPGKLDCPKEAAQADGPEDPEDKFKIYEDDLGKICAKRTDAASPWGVHLVVSCTKVGHWETPAHKGSSRFVGMVEVVVGSSMHSSTKCVDDPGDIYCDDEASQRGRPGEFPDTFHIYHENGKICAHRTDHNDPWGMHLVLHCFRKEMPKPKPEEPFDCYADLPNAWESAKVQYCCANKKLGCDMLPDDTDCHGSETDWETCPSPEECDTCEPVDCVFAEWTSWKVSPGQECSGLRYRRRAFARQNNHCGKPCHGMTVDSQAYMPPECKGDVTVDCKFSDWTLWAGDCSDPTGQQKRSRELLHDANSLRRRQCDGALNQTKACNGRAVDCKFTEWHEWSECSAKCGVGRRQRMRDIDEESFGGLPCDVGITLYTEECEIEPCGDRNCELSFWTEWSGCVGADRQQYRSRRILQAPRGEGQACDPELLQTQGCPPVLERPLAYLLSDWGAWQPCTRSCGGGQTFRQRAALGLARFDEEEKANYPLKETKDCNSDRCADQYSNEDCLLSDWEEWSDCSTNCGDGSKTRHRKILRLAGPGGKGCEATMMESDICNEGDCVKQDCQWGDWAAWSACPCSCGGGITTRHRYVFVAPRNGGVECDPREKEEVEACNTQPCQSECRDGTWGEWMEWTSCSATCSGSYKSRRRDVLIPPNHCGQPPTGLQEEFEACEHLPECPDAAAVLDCAVSDWGLWSDCSCSCDGVRERNRFVSVFAKNGGKPCQEELREIEACNPTVDEEEPSDCPGKKVVEPVDCVLAEWRDWTPCSVTCGGGQHSRHRSIFVKPKGGGETCRGALEVTEPCYMPQCFGRDYADCQLGSWTEWSDCSGCRGQKRRHRSIMKLPDTFGRQCAAAKLKETTACSQDGCYQKPSYCAWTQWTGATSCFGYGSSTAMRSRVLTVTEDEPLEGVFFNMLGADSSACSNIAQVNVTWCPGRNLDCSPEDCIFGAWTDWSQATHFMCERHRQVARRNNECGEACIALEETKVCETEEVPRDCLLGDWQEWSFCDTADPTGQKYRFRKILHDQKYGGLPCRGSLHQTKPCPNKQEPVDCELSSWTEWGSCSESCGRGWHTRERSVIAVPMAGGERCADDLVEMQPCSTYCEHAVPVDCELTDWSAWGHCDEEGQRYRQRDVLTSAEHGGEGCDGNLLEAESCDLSKIDCEVSDWVEWSDCDRSCGTGQLKRQRQIVQFPRNGGELCPSQMIQTTGCNLGYCPTKNCEESQWSEWGGCSVSCGVGEEKRERTVLQLRSSGGEGCDSAVSESRPCHQGIPWSVRPCKMSDWSSWGECSVTCGSGQRGRTRTVTPPENGGEYCEPASLSELEGCKERSCVKQVCVDGEWGDWEEWSPCDVSCGGGTTFRRRHMAVAANECGKPAEGLSREEAFCNVDHCHAARDCVLSEWSDWTSCSATCNGNQKRERSIIQHGRSGGVLCDGDIHETQPCNPGLFDPYPDGCGQEETKDCKMGNWTEWSECSATCDGGAKVKRRAIVQHRANGGRPCTGSLTKIQGCAEDQCEGGDPVACEFGDWRDWSACDQCDGERKRKRNIKQYAQNGGSNCDAFAGEEVDKCPRSCVPGFCTWSTWGSWGSCHGCGRSARRERTRELRATENAAMRQPPLSETRVERLTLHHSEVTAAQDGYTALVAEVGALRTARDHKLTLAFGLGLVTVPLGFAFLRLLPLLRARTTGYSSLLPSGAE